MAKKKASRQKKMQTRVDFTPMVDMMMLLITFFMLCTSLAKPQTMNLTMPLTTRISLIRIVTLLRHHRPSPFMCVVTTRSITWMACLSMMTLTV